MRGVLTDVADPDSVVALADDVYGTEGRCDLLFANAGVTSGGGGLPWEQEINDWRWCFSVNVFGVAATVLAFLPRMLEAGTPAEIIATSSGDGGVAPVPYASVYASSKAAVSCFIEAVAHQLRDRRRPGRRPRLLSRRGPPRHRAVDGGPQPTGRPRTGPAPSAGPGDHLRRVQGPAGGGRAPGRRSSTSTGSGSTVLDHLDDGPLHPRPRLRTASGPCSTPGPTPSAHGELPPTLLALASSTEATEESPTWSVATPSSRPTPTAGPTSLDYRPYLASQFHDEFDAWAATYEVPFADLLGPIRYRNWDSDRRMAEHEADGIVAEVLFPNTVPPFFEEGNLVALPPSEADYERRWAGVQAHNRWVADFCAAAPGRRAGVVQVFVNHLDDALAEISLGGRHTSTSSAASCSPRSRPARHLPRCTTRTTTRCGDCAKRWAPSSTSTAGSGLPDYGDLEVARAIMLVELPWFCHRPLWHLIFGGVFERFPGLKVALTEQGVAWLPRGLETLDWFYGRMDPAAGRPRPSFFGAAAKGMSMKPSEYFARNIWLGASFLRSSESALRPGFGARPGHVGRRLPPLRGHLALQPRGPAGGLRRRGPRRRPALRGWQRRRSSTASTWRPWPRWRPRSGPSVDEIADADRLRPTTRPHSTSNAFDTTQVLRAW